jgi:uncharacterized protein (TIGR02246 family)
MTMVRRVVNLRAAVVGGCLVLALAPALPAQRATQERGQARDAERAGDQAAIQRRTQEFLRAVSRADARALAAFWTDQGEYARGDDLTIRGRENIEKAYAESLKQREPAEVELQNDSVRFLADDTALQEGRFLVKPSNSAERPRSRFVILYIRVNSQWQIGLLREWPEGPSLQELAWLVGTWSSASDGGDARAVFEWTENRKFLRGNFTMKQEDRAVSGFQILALDPATGSIKAWTFGGDGDLGEAVWTRTEKGWSVKTTGVTSEGEPVISTTLITRIDEDSFTWQSVDRTVDGEKQPDVGPVKVVRARAGK